MTTISLKRTSSKMTGLALPIAIAALAATAAYAGADTTFTPALTKFTYTCMFIVCSRINNREKD